MLAKGLNIASKAAPTKQLSIHSYYLWSGILYCGCGILIIATTPQIFQFLCSIPPKGFDEAAGLCYNCSDNLLFCQKSACWQEAINITYILEAKTQELNHFRSYKNGIRDEQCSQLVMEADSPVSFLVAAKRMVDNEDPLDPWDRADCLAFHCAVMRRAIDQEPDLNALTGDCSNIVGSKPPSSASECPCRDLVITPEDAEQISDPAICDIADGSIKQWAFQKYLSLQDECFQNAMNAALTRVTQELNTNTQESADCTNPLTMPTTTVNVFLDAEGTVLTPVDPCRFSFCHAFNASLTDEFCEWGYQVSLTPDSDSTFQDIAAVCQSIIDDFQDQNLAEGQRPGDVALDRVCRVMIGFLEDEAPQYCLDHVAAAIAAAAPDPGGGAGARRLAADKRAARQAAGHCDQDSCKSRPSLGSSLTPPRAPAWVGPRLLQNTAPAPSAELNAAMPPFTVTPWQPCRCYLPCSPGVMVRDVTCLTEGGGCQLPKPVGQQDCACMHCADCSVLTMLFTVEICYFVQGVVALLVWVSFLYFEGQGEELAVSFNIPMKILGFVCKNLPGTVRIAVLANLLQLFYVAFISFVPTSVIALHTDCNESALLQTVVLVSLSVCIFQLIYGRIMKKFTRRPPWLYVPPRTRLPTPFKQMRAFTQQLGP